MNGRQIGTWGTTARVFVGVGLLVLAAWLDLDVPTVLLGLIGLPAGFAIALALRGVRATPLRLEAPIWHFVNIAIGLVLLNLLHVAAIIFYGTSMLVAAWRGIGACEIFAISNWLRRRDDRLGCPLFLPVDALEAAAASRT